MNNIQIKQGDSVYITTPFAPLANDTTANITHLQALIRGWNTRNEIFLPYQILPFIQSNLKMYSFTIQQDIARIFCIELNKITRNFEKYTYVHLDPKLAAYSFEGRLIDRHFTLYIEIDRIRAQLLLIPGEKIGSGAYKAIYVAHDIEIQRKFDSVVRQATYIPAVGIVEVDHSIDSIKKGYSIQQEIINNVPKGKFAQVPKPLLPSVDTPLLNVKYKDIRYNSDLHEADISRSLPIINEDTSQRKPFTTQEKMTIFVDIAKTLEAMQEQGYVHRDVKRDNIFLKLEDNGNIKAYLADFDNAQKMGASRNKGDFCFWDILSVNGMVFPTTDTYALVFLMAQSLLPSFQISGVQLESTLILKKKKFEFLRNDTATKCAENALLYNADPVIVNLQKMFMWVKNGQSFTFGRVYTPKEIFRIINNFRNVNNFMLSPRSAKLLDDLVKQINMRIEVLKLFRSLVKANDQLEKVFLKDHNEFCKWKEMAEENPKALYENYVLKHLPSSTFIRETIEALHQQMQ